jgi:DtxR family Mn-dependent transcriptional regulator
LYNLGHPKSLFRRCKIQTQAVEDYLKTIYKIEREQGKVATTVLADRLSVSPSTVTGMIKKLAEMHLVSYQPYQGLVLTEAGTKIALEVIRHHRLIELFLAETLGVPWDRVHAEAHRIEHVLSEDLEDRIDAMLGYPTTDPHGAPIPARDGSVDKPASVQLIEVEPGQTAVVAEVSDRDSAMLRHLGDLGIYPNVQLRLIAVAPFDGPLTLRIGETEHTLGRELARHISVTQIQDET